MRQQEATQVDLARLKPPAHSPERIPPCVLQASSEDMFIRGNSRYHCTRVPTQRALGPEAEIAQLATASSRHCVRQVRQVRQQVLFRLTQPDLGDELHKSI